MSKNKVTMITTLLMHTIDLLLHIINYTILLYFNLNVFLLHIFQIFIKMQKLFGYKYNLSHREQDEIKFIGTLKKRSKTKIQLVTFNLIFCK